MTARSSAAPEPAAIRHLRHLAEYAEVVDLFIRVWEAKTAEDLVNISLLRSWEMSGNYVVGAYRGGIMVGAAVAFRGEHHLHSHIVGVDPAQQGSKVGLQLKYHQRDWALAQGYSAIRWTFDPLVRRNAQFNLSKLGAQVLEYHENLYGNLNDGINDGDDSDRLLVEWTITTSASSSTPRGPADHCADEIARFNGYENEAWETAGPATSLPSADGEVRLVATPNGIEKLRQADGGRAEYWRTAVRQAFKTALDEGFVVTGFTSNGLYTLQRRTPCQEDE